MGRVRFSGFASLLGLAVLGMLSFAPIAEGTISSCQISNEAIKGSSYTSLSAAVVAASAEDTLLVRGTCVGSATIDKNLTLRGQPSGPAAATLDGEQAGSVLTIGKANVTINNLTITNGRAHDGGGIYNSGTVTLSGSSISGSGAEFEGGGIFNAGGTVILNHGTSISGNGGDGGGIFNKEGTLILNDRSSISGNIAVAGGGIYNFRGKVTLNDRSSISGNGGVPILWGAGIYNADGTVTLNDRSSISGNSNAVQGGGIFNFGFTSSSVVTLNDSSSISGNTAEQGGGIYNFGFTSSGVVATLNDSSSIGDNTASYGGGIFNFGGILSGTSASVTLQGRSIISGNTATIDGGGIYNVHGGVLKGAVAGTNVWNNTPNDIVSIDKPQSNQNAAH